MERTGRIGLAAALVFSALYLFSALVVVAPPAPDAPAAEVQRYFVNHDGGLAASAWLGVGAGVAFLVFLAILRRELEPASGWLADVAFAAGVMVATSAAVPLMLQLGLALQAEFTAPETARTLLDVMRFFPPVATGAVFALAGAVALASLRYGALARWAGIASLVYAAYEVFESFTIFGGTEGGFAASESVNLVGTLAFLPWAVAVGAAMARR
jgi:hypothetical protein